MLVTERPGRLRVIRDGKLDPRPIGGVPEVLAIQLAGLMDVALDPKFTDNHLVYLTYNTPEENKRVATALARGRLEGNDLTGVRDIFVADWLPENANGYNSRLAFGRDGMIYVNNGASNSDSAQDPNSTRGKIMRLRDDGSVPPDNPFVGRAGYKPEIYSMGHRNTLGLIVHPVTGELWNNENGPNAATKSILSCRARTTAGQWSVMGAGTKDRGFQRSRGARALNSLWSSGCPPSQCRGWRFTPASDFLDGRTTPSSAACARVKFRARGTLSVSSSTTRWKSFAARRYSPNCTSGSVMFVKAPMGCSTC